MRWGQTETQRRLEAGGNRVPLYPSLLRGIQGNWFANGLPFRIEFINDDTFGYDPVWMNVKVIPEPATPFLLASGALLIRRK